jgi:hypothetical protein
LLRFIHNTIKTMRLSKEYQRFHFEINVSVPYMVAVANATRLQIATSQVTSLQNHLLAWNTKYALYINPETHTDVAILGVKLAYKVFHKEIQAIKLQLKFNKAIELTEEDYAAIGIHKNAKKRYRRPRPVKAPNNSVSLQYHSVTQICTFDPENPTKKALPEDVFKIGRKMVIQPIDQKPPELKAYQPLESIGKTIYKIIFKEGDENCKAYLMTCYINSTGQEGPYSDPLSFTII